MYITISLADVTDHKIDLTADKLSFTGSSNGKKYALDLEFVSFYDVVSNIHTFSLWFMKFLPSSSICIFLL